MNSTVSVPGLISSIMASVMFGIIPWYIQQLGMDIYSVFWNRIVFTAVFLMLIIMVSRQWRPVVDIFRSQKAMLLLVLTALLAGVQWWLFVWAPMEGYTKELSLGYFLLPLTLTLSGRLVYRERISKVQQLAILLAMTGGALELWGQGGLSWVTAGVAGLYPFYFMLRKKAGIPPLAGNFFEIMLYLPVCLVLLFLMDDFKPIETEAVQGWVLLFGLGGLFAVSTLFYVVASSKLSVSLFGLLGYLEPALLFVVAVVVFHEPFSSDQYLSYGLILIAVLVTCTDSFFILVRSRHSAETVIK